MCDYKAMKASAMAMGIIAWITSAGVMAIGILMFLNEQTFDQTKIINPEEKDPLWVATFGCMMIVGGFTFVTGFLGWIGALKEHTTLLLSFLVMSGIAMAGLAAGGGLAVAYKLEIDSDDTAEIMMMNLELATESNGSSLYFDAWDSFQIENQCCGAYNYTDWMNNPEYDLNTPVPISCCNLEDIPVPGANITTDDLSLCYDEAVDPSITTFTYLYNQPCHEALQSWMGPYSAMAYGMMFGQLALQLVATVLAGMLRSDVGDNKVSPGY